MCALVALPNEPYEYLPGLARTRPTRSASEPAGKSGSTAMMLLDSAMCEIGAKSRIASYGRLRRSAGVWTCAV